MRLEIVRHDRPGNVRQISQTLAAHRINVEDLHTERASAPMSGEMLFKANARLILPQDCPLDNVRAELQKIAADLVVEIAVRPHEN
jgi:glycine cleavage system regulatory protein